MYVRLTSVAILALLFSSMAMTADPKPASQVPSVTSEYKRYHLFLRNLATLSRGMASKEQNSDAGDKVRRVVAAKIALSSADTQTLLSVAQDLEVRLAILDNQATEIITKIRKDHKSGNLYPPPPPQLNTLQLAHVDLVNDAIGRIRATLSSSGTEALEAFVLRKQ